MEFLAIHIGPGTLGQIILGLVIFSVAISAWNKFSRRNESAVGGKLSAAHCMGCGWKGNVSKYHRQCPKCGNAITKLNKS